MGMITCRSAFSSRGVSFAGTSVQTQMSFFWNEPMPECHNVMVAQQKTKLMPPSIAVR